MQIECGMYSLTQAGILANKLLKKRLAPHGYYELPHTPGFFKHISHPVQFTLVLDDFCIKYTGKEHINHLLNALKQHYEISEDWEGKLYYGITLKLDYENRYLDTHMPNYVQKQLTKDQHIKPVRVVNTPLHPLPRKYGTAIQEPVPLDESPPLSEKDITFILQVTSSFLYYGRAINPIILHALSTIASQQSAPRENTFKVMKQF